MTADLREREHTDGPPELFGVLLMLVMTVALIALALLVV